MKEHLVVERNVRVPMRDGVSLATDIWRPSDAGRFPVLLARTPYGRTESVGLTDPERLAWNGFVVAVQDCRGRFDSEGEWRYVSCEVDDGFDAVEWLAEQPWSDRQIAMFGPSYLGYTQWLAAVARPPHLVTMIPECCASDYWVASFDAGGAFRLGLRMGWTASVVSQMAETWGLTDPFFSEFRTTSLDRVEAMMSGDTETGRKASERLASLMAEVYRRRPLRGDPLFGERATWLDEIFDHEEQSDSNWRVRNPSTHYGVLDLPAVHVGGWYDIHLQGILTNYQGMRRQAPTRRARDGQRLIVGPWPHWSTYSGVVGDVDFGPDAVLDTTALRVAWFDHWLRAGPEPAMAPVRLFVMGDNVWRDEEEWPLARTQWQSWFLHAGGRLHTRAPGPEDPDTYTYDPDDPVPALGGRVLGAGEIAGAFDQRRLEGRPDVLVYASDELPEALELTGPVVLELWAGSSAPDTDFTGKLVDLHPDGRAINLCEGIVRARHAGLGGPMVPGAAYRFTVDLIATSVVLAPGHRVAIHISSSCFPTWEPNPNTGRPLGTDRTEDLRTADQVIFHDELHPSRLILPVIPR